MLKTNRSTVLLLQVFYCLLIFTIIIFPAIISAREKSQQIEVHVYRCQDFKRQRYYNNISWIVGQNISLEQVWFRFQQQKEKKLLYQSHNQGGHLWIEIEQLQSNSNSLSSSKTLSKDLAQRPSKTYETGAKNHGQLHIVARYESAQNANEHLFLEWGGDAGDVGPELGHRSSQVTSGGCELPRDVGHPLISVTFTTSD